METNKTDWREKDIVQISYLANDYATACYLVSEEGHPKKEEDDALIELLKFHKDSITRAVEEEDLKIADKIKQKFNGFDGTLGFTQNELLNFLTQITNEPRNII